MAAHPSPPELQAEDASVVAADVPHCYRNIRSGEAAMYLVTYADAVG